ncbi:MAG: MBOAT family protein [Bacteroidales bacterium]|nr:MBOAT family protein [Bacteroidales bacterium]
MLFNSIGYLIFLPVIVILYYALPYRWRWALLLAGSYFFYILWRVEFVLILMSATLVSYLAALKMGQKAKKKDRKIFLIISIVINLGMLVFFKYLGFFTDIINQFAAITGNKFSIPYYGILLPIGISFYTFQTIGYTLDVYRGVIKPEKNIGIYALFVSFFPLVLAGPIERGRRLIPQFHVKHDFDPQLFTSGLRLILWGMFKKIVIADRLSIFVQPVFSNIAYFHGIEIAIAGVMKMMQVYADFSGYTDIAIGSARLMGFRLSANFNRPFSAQSISDFWHRWHISLTSWLRDYVYFSLPFKYHGKTVSWRLNINLLITFVLVGFWHGPYWNFIIFGFLHGSFMILANITKPVMNNFNRITGLSNSPFLLKTLNITATFLLVCFTGFFFGQHPLRDSFLIIENLTDFSQTGKAILLPLLKNNDLLLSFALIIFMLWFEYLIAMKSFATKFMSKPVALRYSAYLFMLFFILVFGIFSSQKFFYFQF